MIEEIKVKDKILLEKSTIPFCIYRYDSGKIVAIIASQGFCDIFNLSHEDTIHFLNNDRYKYYKPSEKKGGGEAFHHFKITGGIYIHEFQFKKTLDGEYIDMYSRGFHLYTTDGSRLLLIFYYYDKDEIKKLKEEKIALTNFENIIVNINKEYVSFAKTRDEKTGLLSMSYFYEVGKYYSDSMIDEGKNPVFIAFDFINMRGFNSKYGFEEGNHLIEKFGNVLRAEFGDYNCSHFSADHFYAFADEDEIEKRIFKIFETLKSINGGKTISTRCGIYVNRSGKKIDATTSCDRAKIACDSPKNALESVYVFFDDDMLKNLENEAYVINNLENAIDKKWIQVYYQPIIRGITGKVSDCEALARWIDPIKGILRPIEFIPILENAKLLYKLDLYMLDSILLDFKRREKQGLPLIPISINLSRYDFESVDMASEISRRIEASGYSTNLITVEITESVVGSNPELLKEQISRFHQKGIKVWMDDFGSGYSSLNALSDYEFDLIKLDMNFIRRLKENPKVGITIRNLIHMAEELGIDFLCEGVETQDEADFLVKTGCDKLQGFYYGVPLPLNLNITDDNIMDQELPGEGSYYENIAMKSLYNLSSNSDMDSYLVHEIGNNVGIVEYKDGNYYYLRGTKTYRNFLRKYNCFKDHKDNKLSFGYSPDLYRLFNNTVMRAIQSKEWENLRYELNDGISTNTYIKCIGKNEVSKGYALMIVQEIATLKNNRLSKKYEHVFSVPFAVFKVITNDDNTKVIDTKYVYANEVYCDSINKSLSDIVDRRFLDVTPNANEKWFPYCYEAAVLGKTVRDSIYSPETRQWLSFVVAPTEEPLCCNFVFMSVDKDDDNTKQLLSKNFSDEAMIKITNILNVEKDNKQAFSRAVLEIKRVFNADYAFLLFDKIDGKDIILGTKSNNDSVDLIKNEYISLIKSLNKEKDSDGIIDVTFEEGKNLFRGTSKIIINNLYIVPILDNKNDTIGHIGLLNCKHDNGILYKGLLKNIASHFSTKIIGNLMFEKLKYQSEYDALTNVFNRKGFSNCSDDYFENHKNTPAVYIIMDIDDFKFINDLNGHYVGDETLKHFAKLVESFFGPTAIVGRSGGDEFQVLLTNTTIKQALPLIDKFTYLEKKLVVDGKEIVYDASMGYAEYPTQASNKVKLYTSADAALYYSKTTQGASANQYRPEMNMARRSQLGFGLKDIAGNMPAAMLIYEALGEEKILYVNDELVKMFECDDTDDFLRYVKGSFMGMLHPEDLDNVEASIWKQINENSDGLDNDFVDYRIITKTGKIKHVIDNGRLVDSKYYGKVFYVILIEEDPHVEFKKRASEHLNK
ncbi:MAG: EAL domain-containing protein [Acholeplasmatales bacterium]|nr:EAL domain-containing protein [Acholeplasmatales bacterium]